MEEIDLHGMRYDEARETVIKFVDSLIYNGIGVGKIIHGHGELSGHIQKWVAEYPISVRLERDSTNFGATKVFIY